MDLRQWRNNKNSIVDIRKISQDVKEVIYQEEDDDIDLLKEVFIETKAYNDLWGQKKFLLVGRKGTGKSALRRYFCYQAPSKNAIAKYLKFKKLLDSDSVSSISSDSIKTGLESKIVFTICIELVQFLSEHYPDDKDLLAIRSKFPIDFDPAGLLLKILDENDFLTQIKRLQGAELEALGNSFKLNFNLKDRQDLKLFTNQLKHFLFKKIASFDKRIILFIDEVDYKIADDWAAYRRILVDYIKIIFEDFNKDFVENFSSDKFKIILSLRSDFIDGLHGLDANLNKLLTDKKYISDLDWHSNGRYFAKDCPINELLEKRLEYGLRESGFAKTDIVSKSKPYYESFLEEDKIFSEKFHEKPQTFEDFSKRFFYSWTFLRPRDVLRFFYYATTSETLTEFSKIYSKYLWGDLINEMSHLLSGNDKSSACLIIEQTLHLLFKGAEGRFTKERFCKLYATFDYDPLNNPEKILSMLYDYSVIGANIDEFGIFKYRDVTPPPFASVDEFVLHKGLKRYFNAFSRR